MSCLCVFTSGFYGASLLCHTFPIALEADNFIFRPMPSSAPQTLPSSLRFLARDGLTQYNSAGRDGDQKVDAGGSRFGRLLRTSFEAVQSNGSVDCRDHGECAGSPGGVSWGLRPLPALRVSGSKTQQSNALRCLFTIFVSPCHPAFAFKRPALSSSLLDDPGGC